MSKTEVDTTESGDFWAGVQSSRMRVMQPLQNQRGIHGLESRRAKLLQVETACVCVPSYWSGSAAVVTDDEVARTS